jgi:hypothetical protein
MLVGTAEMHQFDFALWKLVHIDLLNLAVGSNVFFFFFFGLCDW